MLHSALWAPRPQPQPHLGRSQSPPDAVSCACSSGVVTGAAAAPPSAETLAAHRAADVATSECGLVSAIAIAAQAHHHINLMLCWAVIVVSRFVIAAVLNLLPSCRIVRTRMDPSW